MSTPDNIIPAPNLICERCRVQLPEVCFDPESETHLCDSCSYAQSEVLALPAKYIAFCGCGWESYKVDTNDQAESVYVSHLVETNESPKKHSLSVSVIIRKELRHP